MFFDSLKALIVLSFVLNANAGLQLYDLPIVNANIAPDGFTRPTVLAGGTYPGTLITGFKGDQFQINVQNELHDLSMLKSTSIHWHGLFQHGTNWADGPSFVNQCPIAANNSFTYEFSVPGQAGTFWYHSHLSTQYCDGLRGPLILYDPEDPYLGSYEIDDESTVITVGDWYHTPAPSAGPVPVPDSALINGLGRDSTGSTTAPLAVIFATPLARHRYRLISISCDANYIFSIDNHNFTIIETDGVETQKLTVDSIQIFAAQRYSFILTANQPIANYWIRLQPDVGFVGFTNNANLAILRYLGAPLTDPTTNQTASVIPFLETNLHPLTNPAAPGLPEPGGVDVAYNLVLNFDFTTFLFEINGVSFQPPTVPVLLQILSGTQNAADLLPAGSVYALPKNSTIELSFPNDGVAGLPHPFHLHGHTFSVVRSANSSVYNYENPVQRDVVSTGQAGDNVTIRFVTDNAGPWFLHCHIDWHLNLGFAVVLVEDAPDIATVDAPPTSWSNLCPIYDALSPSQL